MSESALPERRDTGFDRILGFTVPDRSARGRLVRLGPVLDTVLSAHDYPAPVRHLLAEALVLTALMGSLLKDEDCQLTMQAQAQGGAVDLMVCDYRSGKVRGYVRHDPALIAGIGASPSLETLFGEGYLAITFDLAASEERYQGIVPLEGRSLSEACEIYFERSEQIPTMIRVGVTATGEHTIGGGLLVQHFPDGEEGRERLHIKEESPDWEHVATLAASTKHEELVDSQLGLEQLVWRLFHEESQVRVEPLAPLERGCRCSIEHYRTVLARFPESERAEMRNDDGLIPVDCAFCSKILNIDV